MVRRKRTEALIETAPEEAPAIRHLRDSLARGRHWYLALLEAIGLWERAEEELQGQTYRYLIDGEAFDWLLLAERLCHSVDGLLSQAEVEGLLLRGRPPLELSRREFKELVGPAKYRAYLNYFYGVLVEEALLLAVEAEVQKEDLACARCRDRRTFEDGYQRIYGLGRERLLRRFREEQGYPRGGGLPLQESKEFTYWLFKYRLRHCDPARVASDTKKGLVYLWRLQRRFAPGLGAIPLRQLEPAASTEAAG